jgi:hypothetical protein
MATLSQLNLSEMRERIEWFGEVLASDLEEARLLYEDMLVNGLTTGTIEAEGFLRAHITLLNTFHKIIYGDE